MFCVYTCRWNDKEDVLRVGLALREATGRSGLLTYKTDVHTLAGAYSGHGNSVCCYRLAAGAQELSVDEDVVAQARALNDDEPPEAWGAGGAGPSRAAHAQPAKRPRNADAVPPEFIDLCDSDDDGAGAHKAHRSGGTPEWKIPGFGPRRRVATAGLPAVPRHALGRRRRPPPYRALFN